MIIHGLGTDKQLFSYLPGRQAFGQQS
jgi:hypothetical protein